MRPIATRPKEKGHARQAGRNLFPPEPTSRQRIALHRLWEILRPEARQRTLQILGRIVGQQLQLPPNIKEEHHEDC